MNTTRPTLTVAGAGSHRSPMWQVLRAVWQRRRNQGSMWPLLFMAVGVTLIAGLATLMLHVPLAAMLAAAGALLLAMAWFWLVSDLQVQNQPHAARLVPGHARALRQVWLGGWIGLTIAAWAIGVVFGHGVAATLISGAVLLLISWLVRWPWLGFGGWIAAASAQHLRHSEVWSMLAAHDPGAPVWGLLLLAAVIASWSSVIQNGSARHHRNYRRRVPRGTDASNADGRGPRNALQIGLRQAATWPYRQWLAHATASRSGSVLSRALLGLGPMLHWSGIVGLIAVYGGVGVGFWSGVWWINAPSHRLPSWSGMANVLVLGMVFFSVITAATLHLVIYRTRREQALLMLLPGMPRGAELNLPLTRRMLRQFLGGWLLIGMVMIGVGASAGSGWTQSVIGASLWPMAGLCTDWARMRLPSGARSAGQGLLVAVLIGLATLAHLGADIPVELCTGLLIVGALGWTAWRYRLVMRAPTAFPAARLR